MSGALYIVTVFQAELSYNTFLEQRSSYASIVNCEAILN
jgi:hypothetical protein